MNARLIVMLSLLITACGAQSGPPLVAEDIEVTRPMPGTSMSAGYMTLTNNSNEQIRITSVSSPQFAVAELHETVIENDIARMRPVEALVIEAGATARLERGGMHLMLMQPRDEAATVTLNLFSEGLLLLTVQTAVGEG